jgi:hypothetical protein
MGRIRPVNHPGREVPHTIRATAAGIKNSCTQRLPGKRRPYLPGRRAGSTATAPPAARPYSIAGSEDRDRNTRSPATPAAPPPAARAWDCRLAGPISRRAIGADARHPPFGPHAATTPGAGRARHAYTQLALCTLTFARTRTRGRARPQDRQAAAHGQRGYPPGIARSKIAPPEVHPPSPPAAGYPASVQPRQPPSIDFTFV